MITKPRILLTGAAVLALSIASAAPVRRILGLVIMTRRP